MKQIVAHKKFSPIMGMAIVLGLVAALVLLNYLVINVLAVRIGPTAATISFWVIGCALALIVLRVFIVRYSYELGTDVLRLCRAYGKRERFIEDIYLRSILSVGTEEDVRKRHPGASTVRALRKVDGLPVTAIAYKDSKGERIALIQANDELKNRLIEIRQSNKK